MHHKISKFFSKAFAKLRYDLWDAPRGRGRSPSKEVWDDQFRSGAWNALDVVGEVGHYAVLAAYVPYIHPNPDILDIGCGHGELVKHLKMRRFNSYLGVDLSSEAVEQASAAHGSDNIHFVSANFDSWSAEKSFDLIIFNESLYYSREPVVTLDRYADCLRLSVEGGLLISMCEYGNHAIIWRQIEEKYSVAFSSRVENERKQAWNIKGLKSPGSARGGSPSCGS
jgi:SAM-dependent methyltransferase